MRALITGVVLIMLGVAALVPGAGYSVNAINTSVAMLTSGSVVAVDSGERQIPPWVGAAIIVGGLTLVAVGAVRSPTTLAPGLETGQDANRDAAPRDVII
jgi:hypothetical protein